MFEILPVGASISSEYSDCPEPASRRPRRTTDIARRRGSGLRSRLVGMGVVCQVALSILFLGVGTADAADGVMLASQGWSIVDRSGSRMLQLGALVINHSDSSLHYRVRFLIQQAESFADRVDAAHSMMPDENSPSWATVKTIPASTGAIAPGTSASVQASIPHDELVSGQAYRFRAEVEDAHTGAVLEETTIKRSAAALKFAGALVGVAALTKDLWDDDAAGADGAGVMFGRHEAHRVSGEWVETGSGTIDICTSEGRLLLDYTYGASGPNAATLAVSGTATGDLFRREGAPLPATFTSTSLEIIFPGVRNEDGPVILRYGAKATGSFIGTVGDTSWSGVVTLSNGTHTLDPATGEGEHRFDIQLVSAVSSAGPALVSPGPEIAVGR